MAMEISKVQSASNNICIYRYTRNSLPMTHDKPKLKALVLLLVFVIRGVISTTITTSKLNDGTIISTIKTSNDTIALQCPYMCQCKNGDQNSVTTDCSNANLTSVPSNITASTAFLHLSKNKISNFRIAEFSPLNLLKRLWVDDNDLSEIPIEQLKLMPLLEALSIANNRIKVIPNYAFQHQRHLAILNLQGNEINDIAPLAFIGLDSLKVLEINRNRLNLLPVALSQLHSLRELTIANNELKYIPDYAFRNNSQLTILELKGNPIEDVARAAFTRMPNLKKLTLSESRKLGIFPDFQGTSSLEHLKIDRGELIRVPSALCNQVPHLKSLIVKSNRISSLPKLRNCRDLRLLDLSYNHITTFGEESPFLNQSKLIDLFLGHNFITNIPEKVFVGLSGLKVLDLVGNRIASIHSLAFAPLVSLKDLNLGNNKFPVLPIIGLENVTEIKVYGNPYLEEFPPPESFPKVHTLALSYAYHCCAYLGRTLSPTDNPTSLQESIVWLEKEDLWNTNVTDVWPGYVNFSTKFEEFANQLWKAFGRDYVIPDNLAEYAEQYFDDYKQIYGGPDDGMIAQYLIQCIPQPGPFMPCKDLFDWWTLRCGVWIVFLLALLGNGVVVVVLLFGRSKIDVPRFLVCNLAVADFFMGVYLGILAVVDAATLGEFKAYAIPWQTSWGCQLAGFFGVFSSELSVYTLAVITLERNYAITHAMHLNKRLSLKHAGYIMTVGFTFAIIMALLPLFGISDYRKFAVCLPFEIEDSPWSLAYVVFLIIINGVAFLVLMGCYLRMYCAIRGSQAWNSNDSRIAKRMALLVFTDFLCWAPIAFFSLTAVFGLNLISLEEAKVFTIFVLPLNSCANPFLYAIFTKQFKKDCVLLCKRIEESRVTRGIGRCRHSSNFSNRHTPANTNSAADRKSGSDNLPQLVCQCGVRRPKVSIEEVLISKPKVPASLGWKQKVSLWFKKNKRHEMEKPIPEYTNANAQNQKNNDKGNRTSSISSENFSSRSDSWRQANIPMRLIDKGNHSTPAAHVSGHTHTGRGRRNSWNVTRKTSQDSSLSVSRQDSSSSTVRMSRSSVSSDSSSKQTATSTLSTLSTSSAGPSGTQNYDIISTNKMEKLLKRNVSLDKPQLCRQTAVDEKHVGIKSKSPPYRRANTGYLCQNCARKEPHQFQLTSAMSPPKKVFTQFKNKELEEKFNCFYNRLAETSQEDTSEDHDHAIVSLDQSTGGDHKMDLSIQSKDTADTSLQESVTSSQHIDTSDYMRAQPSIEIEPQASSLVKRSFDGDESSRGSSTRSIRTQLHLSHEIVHDPNKLHISSDKIDKSHSVPNIGCAGTSNMSGRKATSDNSLRRLSIKNLPSMLRSISSQSTQYLGKKKKKLFTSGGVQSHRNHRSVECFPTIGQSTSYEALQHQMSDSNLSNLTKRRSTAHDLFQRTDALLRSDDADVHPEGDDTDDDDAVASHEAERNKLLKDNVNVEGDNSDNRKKERHNIKQSVEPCSSVGTNDEVPLIDSDATQRKTKK